MAEGNDSETNNHHMSPETWMEILSWLPGKSLMRFKSISKQWFFLITDPVFVEMHQARSYAREDGSILVNFRCYSRHCVWDRRYLVININNNGHSGKASICNLSSLLSHDINTTTNIVNGLVCFYDKNCNDESIYLYNLTTREILCLPTIATSRREKFRERIYFLGFDPTNKEYKVICILRDKCEFSNPVLESEVFSSNSSNPVLECKLFTVGNKDTRWRPIDISYIGSGYAACLVSAWFADHGVCFDGILYWVSQNPRSYTRNVTVFHVVHEKFEFFKYPKDQESKIVLSTHTRKHPLLVELRYDFWTFDIILWRLIDGKDNNKPLWTKEVTACEYPGGRPGPFLHNCSGQVFLLRPPISDECIVDCFDVETGKHKELRISNAQGILFENYYQFSPWLVVEHIISLKNMTTQMLSI